jgi:SAM domain (Sterile alpha motif)
MKGIAEWLVSIGLSEYAQRFADNGIDLSVIRDLTEQDLRISAFCWGIAAGFCARSRSLMGSLPHRLEQRPNRCCVRGPSVVTSP